MTMLAIGAFDGRPLTDNLRIGTQSWPLSGWWMQIPVSNPSRLELTAAVDLSEMRKIQVQKWEQ